MTRGRRPGGPELAFLAHPRDLEDARRAPSSSLLSAHSKDDATFREALRTIPPTRVADLRFGFQPVWGELVCISRLPEEMGGAEAVRSVADAARVAIHRGARVVGLGALTSPATGSGLRLLGDLAPGVTVTTGNALTAAVVRTNVLEAAAQLGLGSDARVAVVGCTGSVGGAASRLLADRGFRLSLVGRTQARVRTLLGDLRGAEPADAPAALAGSDVIVLLTSAPDARVLPDHVRPGTVVIDCAQPANVDRDDLDAFADRGVAVVEGALVTIPGYTCGFDFRLSRPGAAFACLAETYLFAREGLREHSVGRATVEQALRMERLAERRGIEAAPLGRRDGRGAMMSALGGGIGPRPEDRWDAPTEQPPVPRQPVAEA